MLEEEEKRRTQTFMTLEATFDETAAFFKLSLLLLLPVLVVVYYFHSFTVLPTHTISKLVDI